MKLSLPSLYALASSILLSTAVSAQKGGGGPPVLPSQSRIHPTTMTTNPIAEKTFDVSSGAAGRVTLSSCSSGSDPVLRVFNYQGVEIARNHGSSLYFSGQFGPETMLVHGSNSTTSGTCNYTVQRFVFGFYWQSIQSGSIDFGGSTIRVLARQSDSIIAGYSRVGADNLQMLITVAAVGGPARTTYKTAGVRRAPLDIKFDVSSFLASSQNQADVFVIVGSKDSSGKEMKIYINDEDNDQDGDGLGTQLESALNTCDNSADTLSTGWPCWSYSPTDTDNDGISDGVEVFGKQNPTAFPETVLPFAWMGANPAQRDVFVEHDWTTPINTLLVNSGNIFLYEYFRSQSGRDQIARKIQITDKVDTRSMNPSGETGVFFHFDIQGSPGTGPANGPYPSQHLTTFDLGGGNLLPPAFDLLGSANTSKTAFKGNISPIRVPYFRYQIAQMRRPPNLPPENPSLGGQAGGGLLYGYFPADQSNSGNVSMHELGHNLGLLHGGSRSPENFKYNYFSIMNYRFQNRADVGYSLASGQVLNPRSLCEADGLNGAEVNDAAHLADLGANHGFLLSGAGVDWNRDGIISDCSNPVTASLQRGSVSSSSTPKMLDVDTIVTSGASVFSTPSITRTPGGALALVYARNSQVQIRVAPYTDGTCHPGSNEGDNVCYPWSQETYLGVDGDEVSIAVNGLDIYLTVLNGQTVRTYKHSSGTYILDNTLTLSGAQNSTPASIVIGDRLLVVWRESDGSVAFAEKKSTSWSVAKKLNLDGSDLLSNAPLALTKNRSSEVFMTYTDASDSIHVAKRLADRTWITASEYDTLNASIKSLNVVGVAWRPSFAGTISGDAGYLVLTYSPKLTTNSQRSVNYIDHHGGTGLFLQRLHPAVAEVGTGTATYLPPGGSNVVTAMITVVSSTASKLLFYPKADGIAHSDMDATDDFEIMSFCSGVIESSTANRCSPGTILPEYESAGDVSCNEY